MYFSRSKRTACGLSAVLACAFYFLPEGVESPGCRAASAQLDPAKAHDARCDGATDDTSIIQFALDEPGRHVVQLPSGRCRVTAMLKMLGSGVVLAGQGMGITYLVADFSHNAQNPATILASAKDPENDFIKNAGVRGISIVADQKQPEGVGLRLVMPNGFTWRDSEILGHAVGLEIVGGYNVFADDTHINAAPLAGEKGTRYVVLRAQQRANGSWHPPQGVHVTNFNWSGDNQVEYGLEVRAADGVYLANGYIGEATKCQLLVNADPADKYVITTDLTGVYLDGNHNSECGAELRGRAVDMKFTGATIANFTDACLRIESDDVKGVTVSGGSLMNCRSAVVAPHSGGLVLNGLSFAGAGPIRIGNHAIGPFAISGNAFLWSDGNDFPIVIENDGDHLPLPAMVSVFGNAFAKPGPPVRFEAPAAHLTVTPTP